jgi:hypothetical protein
MSQAKRVMISEYANGKGHTREAITPSGRRSRRRNDAIAVTTNALQFYLLFSHSLPSPVCFN